MLPLVVGEAKANLKAMVERREKEKINEINGQPVNENEHDGRIETYTSCFSL